MKNKPGQPTVAKPVGEGEFTAEMLTQWAGSLGDAVQETDECLVKEALRLFILGVLLERIDAACDGSDYVLSLVSAAHVRADAITECSLLAMDQWLEEFFNPETEI